MNNMIDEMLKHYNAVSVEEKKNAIKEIIQEIVLCGLSRAGFFNKAAFYGGTALRIFYGLDRFSENLDFSLKVPDRDFSLAEFFPVLEKELSAYGLKLSVAEKEKSTDSDIKSPFLKGNTKEHILLFYTDERLADTIAATETIKVKFEVDTNPPAGAEFESNFRLLPSPYAIDLYDMPSLFAGKIHAVICRAWKNRIKGRDLYDYVFYLSKSTPVNLYHLKCRLAQSGVISMDTPFTIENLRAMLCDRFDSIDYRNAKEDVRPFIKDTAALDLWSAEFFRQITKNLSATE